jgi:hypothetical protein
MAKAPEFMATSPPGSTTGVPIVGPVSEWTNYRRLVDRVVDVFVAREVMSYGELQSAICADNSAPLIRRFRFAITGWSAMALFVH